MNDWLQRLQVQIPLWNAGMGLGIAGPKLAVAVGQAGGFGVLGLGAYPPEAVRGQIRAMRALGDRPFGVNLLLPMTVDHLAERHVSQRSRAL